jgi:hypothetical protein
VAQPALQSLQPFQLQRRGRRYSTCEIAIRGALGLENIAR